VTEIVHPKLIAKRKKLLRHRAANKLLTENQKNPPKGWELPPGLNGPDVVVVDEDEEKEEKKEKQKTGMRFWGLRCKKKKKKNKDNKKEMETESKYEEEEEEEAVYDGDVELSLFKPDWQNPWGYPLSVRDPQNEDAENSTDRALSEWANL